MIGATEEFDIAARVRRYLRAAMAAAVEQHIHLAITGVPHHQNRLTGEAGRKKIAGVRDLALMPHIEPSPAKNPFGFPSRRSRDRGRRPDARDPRQPMIAAGSPHPSSPCRAPANTCRRQLNRILASRKSRTWPLPIQRSHRNVSSYDLWRRPAQSKTPYRRPRLGPILGRDQGSLPRHMPFRGHPPHQSGLSVRPNWFTIKENPRSSREFRFRQSAGRSEGTSQ